jgi:pyridoxine kinase
MKGPVPRTAAIHDLSGFGRASLTVIIPILSTMGIQVCPLPTAVFSTHTGGFQDYRCVDLSDHMRSMIQHWRSLDLSFDAIYGGFLGSSEQIEIVSAFIDSFSRANQLVLIDPGELKQWLIRLSDFGPATVILGRLVGAGDSMALTLHRKGGYETTRFRIW